MTRIAVLLLLVTVALCADNTWNKVQEIKNRTELRIYRKGAREPINATFYEANEDRIVVVIKNKQEAIPKEDIERLDARPAATTPRKIETESKVKTTDPDFTPRPNPGIPAPGTSYSTGVSMSGGKRDFETVYRKIATPPAH